MENSSARARRQPPRGRPRRLCGLDLRRLRMLYLCGHSRTTYMCIHLNNDLTARERQPQQLQEGA